MSAKSDTDTDTESIVSSSDNNDVTIIYDDYSSEEEQRKNVSVVEKSISIPVNKPKIIKIDTSHNDGLFGLYQSGISQKTYENFLMDYSKLEPTDDFTLSIYTNGGSMFYTILIANILTNHKGRITALITKYAMSGGALLAIMCDSIQMSESACLGCIDLQMHLPIKHVLPTLTNFRHRNVLCSLGYDLLSSYETTYETKIKSLLIKKYSKEEVEKIYDFFCNHTDHAIPIFPHELPSLIKVYSYVFNETHENPIGVKTSQADALSQMMKMMMGR